MLFGTGKVVDRLYYLDCHATVQDHATVAARPQSGNTADLWQQCLGHLNGGQLKEMATHDVVKVPKDRVFSFCEECVEGKVARKPFKSVGEVHSVRKQCVHSDVRMWTHAY